MTKKRKKGKIKGGREEKKETRKTRNGRKGKRYERSRVRRIGKERQRATMSDSYVDEWMEQKALFFAGQNEKQKTKDPVCLMKQRRMQIRHTDQK